LCGFEDHDLELFLPVALDIEASFENSTNATMEDKLKAFRRAPVLQRHFQDKIRAMLVEPMQDLQKLSRLKERYLGTSSRVEKGQIKREIQQLEKSMTEKSDNRGSSSRDIVEESSTFGGIVSLDFNLDQGIAPLPEDEMEERIRAVKALPPVLQVLYKRRVGVVVDEDGNDDDDDQSLRLAILIEHYEKQLEVLEKVRLLAPLNDEQRSQVLDVVERIPMSVRNHFAKDAVGLGTGENATALVEELEASGDDPSWNSLKIVMEASGSPTTSSETTSEYEDLDFLDRSRYVDEFHPAVARMEAQHPDRSDVDAFVSQIIDNKRMFMMNTKPERVMGGYYLRGDNVITDDTSGKKLVERIRQNLEAAPSVKDKIDFFYIPDPAPLSDEEVELGYEDQSLILLTARNDTALYQSASPVTKIAVSTLGILSMALFALGTGVMQPHAQEHIEAALATGNAEDVAWFVDCVATTAGSMIVIQTLHELAHRIVAWKDKVSF